MPVGIQLGQRSDVRKSLNHQSAPSRQLRVLGLRILFGEPTQRVNVSRCRRIHFAVNLI